MTSPRPDASLRSRPRRLVAALAAGLLLLGSCGGERPPGTVPSTPPATGAPAPSPEPSPPPSPTPVPTIEFSFADPQSPCVPVSAIPSIAAHLTGEYALIDPFLEREESRILTICGYERSDLDSERIILDDHVHISSHVTLYREWGESRWYGYYPELPVWSDDLEVWTTATRAGGRDRGVWDEACDGGLPCDDGERPTEQTYAWQALLEGHAGNLEFYVTVTYIAQEIPDDVVNRIVEVFRDVVMASLDNWERAD